MNITDINNLKDTVYELEGLLELAQMREDKIPELTPLIMARIKSLCEDKPKDAQPASSKLKQEPAPLPEQKIEAVPEPYEEPLQEPEDSLFRESAAEEFEEREEKALRPIFCLNDHFRFRKSLFGGDENAFSAAMNMIAGMDSFEEAEAHFIDDLGWDAEDPEVSDFLEILKNYFAIPRSM